MMSQTSQDSLENLRHRARCPVCLTFYIKPKKLNNCSHVVCLSCLKHHLQNSHSNFPKCPMCRKPMLQPFSEVDKYEPARAEQDIVDFVRQFEQCDVCNKPENPNLKCTQCKWYICENCIPCHSKLKPTHVTEPIINRSRDSETIANSALSSENEKSEHEITLFCIMCLTTLCSKGENCREHRQNHDQCSSTWSADDVERMYKIRFFLQPLTESNNALNESKLCEPMKIVSIDKISEAAQKWLKSVIDDVRECVDYLQEYKERLYHITDKTDIKGAPHRPVEFLHEQVNHALCLGKELYEQTNNLLRMPLDIDTAIYLLKNEGKFPLLFQMRRKIIDEAQLVNATCLTTSGQNSIIRQVSKCSIQDIGQTYWGILLNQPFKPKPIQGFYESDKVRGDQINSEKHFKDKSIFSALLTPNNTDQPVQVTRNQSLLGKDFNISNKVLKFNLKAAKSSILIPNCKLLYSNSVLRKLGDKFESPSVSCNHTEISSAFSSDYDYFVSYLYEHSLNGGKPKCFAVKEYEALRHVCICTLLTKFVNIFVHPWTSSTTELSKIIALTGNREQECGLETVLVCFDKSETPVYGISANVNNVKLVKTYRGKGKLGEQHQYNKFSDKKGFFSISRYKNCNCIINGGYSTYYNTKYQTEITETFVPPDFLQSVDKRSQTHNIPVKYLKLDLLCGFENRIYYARHEFPKKISIGVLSFTLQGVKLDNLCEIKQNDIEIPVNNIKPLTITEIAIGDIIAVCSVISDNSKFVMIRPGKTVRNHIEFLDVSYPPSAEISEAWVDEVEMGPKGDIVYVLKDKNGKSHSVFTKFLIEE